VGRGVRVVPAPPSSAISAISFQLSNRTFPVLSFPPEYMTNPGVSLFVASFQYRMPLRNEDEKPSADLISIGTRTSLLSMTISTSFPCESLKNQSFRSRS
jgi:hypothetical protein